MAGVPLLPPPNDTEPYLASRIILIDRTEFDAAVPALDGAWRDEQAEAQKHVTDKKGSN